MKQARLISQMDMAQVTRRKMPLHLRLQSCHWEWKLGANFSAHTLPGRLVMYKPPTFSHVTCKRLVVNLFISNMMLYLKGQ
jgi:hypothetical protein